MRLCFNTLGEEKIYQSKRSYRLPSGYDWWVNDVTNVEVKSDQCYN